MSFEAAARRSALKDILRIYRDPDHRMQPNDERAGTNSDGLRSALEADELPDDGVTVLFLGDSFVFGVQVERERALPQRFEAGLRRIYPDRNVNVVNAAWESASPFLALRLLQDLGPKYRPDIVVYGFDMTDFRDDLMYQNLLRRRGFYRLAAFAPATLWLLNQGAKAVDSENLYRWMFKMPTDRFFPANGPLAGDGLKIGLSALYDELPSARFSGHSRVSDVFCRRPALDPRRHRGGSRGHGSDRGWAGVVGSARLIGCEKSDHLVEEFGPSFCEDGVAGVLDRDERCVRHRGGEAVKFCRLIDKTRKTLLKRRREREAHQALAEGFRRQVLKQVTEEADRTPAMAGQSRRR